MATSRINITKDPQCRHKDEFVTYSGGPGAWYAACSNCSQQGGPRVIKEDARNELMRLIGDPTVIYE